MKKTHLELMTFLQAAQEYKKANPEKSKFSYDLDKIVKQVGETMTKKGHQEVYNTACDDARIKFASEDKNGNLDLNERGGYKFTKDNYKKLLVAIRELTETMNNTEVEIEINTNLNINFVNGLPPQDENSVTEEQANLMLFFCDIEKAEIINQNGQN